MYILKGKLLSVQSVTAGSSEVWEHDLPENYGIIDLLGVFLSCFQTLKL